MLLSAVIPVATLACFSGKQTEDACPAEIRSDRSDLNVRVNQAFYALISLPVEKRK